MTASALASSSAFTGARVAASTAERRTSRRHAARPLTRAAAAAGTTDKTLSIPDTFAALKKRNQCAFIPFICAGDPNLDATEKALHILDDAGADIIELGVPYSDPLADGPTIQARLRRKITPPRVVIHAYHRSRRFSRDRGPSSLPPSPFDQSIISVNRLFVRS